MTEPDYTSFVIVLKAAIASHFPALARLLGDDRCAGYCLYTSREVTSIGPVANRASALELKVEDRLYRYHKYCPDEWSEWDDFGIFADVNAWISHHRTREDYFQVIAPRLLALCVEGLAEQKSAGLFDTPSDGLFLAVWISESKYPTIHDSITRLNSANVRAEFTAEFG